MNQKYAVGLLGMTLLTVGLQAQAEPSPEKKAEVPTPPMVPVPFDRQKIVGMLQNDGPWMFVGYLKNQKLETATGWERGLWFREKCVMVRTGFFFDRAQYAVVDTSTGFAKSLLAPLHLVGFVTVTSDLANQSPSYSGAIEYTKKDERAKDRFVKALTTVVGIVELREGRLTLKTNDGSQLEFVKPQGNTFEPKDKFLCAGEEKESKETEEPPAPSAKKRPRLRQPSR